MIGALAGSCPDWEISVDKKQVERVLQRPQFQESKESATQTELDRFAAPGAPSSL